MPSGAVISAAASTDQRIGTARTAAPSSTAVGIRGWRRVRHTVRVMTISRAPISANTLGAPSSG